MKRLQSSIVVLTVLLFATVAQAGLTADYLSVDGSTGVYAYSTGFGDDLNMTSRTSISFPAGSIDNDHPDKYLTDATFSAGEWERSGSALAVKSTTYTEIVWEIDLAEEGAAGYNILTADIHVGTANYIAGGEIDLLLSTDGASWTTVWEAPVNTEDGWVYTWDDVAVPTALTGTDTLYVKFAGSCPAVNGWTNLYEWGIRADLEVVPEPATMTLLGLSALTLLRRRRS